MSWPSISCRCGLPAQLSPGPFPVGLYIQAALLQHLSGALAQQPYVTPQLPSVVRPCA